MSFISPYLTTESSIQIARTRGLAATSSAMASHRTPSLAHDAAYWGPDDLEESSVPAYNTGPPFGATPGLEGLGYPQRDRNATPRAVTTERKQSRLFPRPSNNETLGMGEVLLPEAPRGTEVVKLQRLSVFQYDINIVGGGKLSRSVERQIFKAFEQRAISQNVEGVNRVSNSSFMAQTPVKGFEQKFTMHIHKTAEDSEVMPELREKYIKTYEHDGDTAMKQWLVLGELEPIPTNRDMMAGSIQANAATHTWGGIRNDLAQEVSVWSGRVAMDDSIASDKLVEYAKQKYAATGRNRWTDTVVVFAKRTEMQVGWTPSADHSHYAQVLNTWMVSEAKPDGYQVGNRIFDEATPLDNGLEIRRGVTVKPGIRSEDDEVHIIKTPCTQHFFHAVQLSDFMIAYAGPLVKDCHPIKAGELTHLLKGVQVTVATTKGGKSRTIRGVTHKTADRIYLPSTDNTASITLAELYEVNYNMRLKHIDLPCINIGFGDSDFFVPAEACKIMPNQPFHHALSVSTIEESFVKRTEMPKLPRSTVTTTNASALDVLFAEVVIIPENSRQVDMDTEKLRLVSNEQWSQFGLAVKDRFGGAIKDSVRDGPPVTLQYLLHGSKPATGHKWASKLIDAVETKTSVGNVGKRPIVIVAVPAGKHNADVYNMIKQTCDTEAGIQCKVIRTDVLTKAVRGPEAKTMRFTGTVVRNLLTRTLDPAINVEDETFRLRFPARPAASTAARGLLVGVHVQPLRDIVSKDALLNRTDKLDGYRLVTITSSAVLRGNNVFTTHHLTTGTAGSNLSAELRMFRWQHMRRYAKNDITHIVVHRSGEGADDRTRIGEEMEVWSATGLPLASQAFIAHTPETVVQLMPKSGPIEQKETQGVADFVSVISQYEPVLSRADSMNGSDIRHVDAKAMPTLHPKHTTNPFGMDAAFLQTYARNFEEVKEATRTYSLTLCYGSHERAGPEMSPQISSASEAGQTQNSITPAFHTVLMNTAIPDILYLAQQASKHSHRYVEVINHGERVDGSLHNPKFRLRAIHEKIRTTLYFI
ncbi:argonaute 5 [Elasticomyces elasticus]|nr:argonaute 5 [Elasticomyces elasticus]